MRKRFGRGAAAAYYRELLAEQKRSGQSLPAFAAARGINRNTLSWWRYELRHRNDPDSAAACELKPVEIVGTLAAPANDVGFEVKLASGDVVYVPQAFEESALSRLLAVLRR